MINNKYFKTYNIVNMKNVTHERYTNEKLICPYCESLTNLYNMTRHMKGKKCQKYKALYLQVNPEKSEAEIELFFNKLSKQVNVK